MQHGNLRLPSPWNIPTSFVGGPLSYYAENFSDMLISNVLSSIFITHFFTNPEFEINTKKKKCINHVTWYKIYFVKNSFISIFPNCNYNDKPWSNDCYINQNTKNNLHKQINNFIIFLWNRISDLGWLGSLQLMNFSYLLELF